MKKGAAPWNRVFSSAWDGSGTVLFIVSSDLLVRLVGRVKELVRLGAVGEAEVVVVDDVHHRRIGRTAQFVGRVRRVESLCPRLFELGGIADAVRERPGTP